MALQDLASTMLSSLPGIQSFFQDFESLLRKQAAKSVPELCLFLEADSGFLSLVLFCFVCQGGVFVNSEVCNNSLSPLICKLIKPQIFHCRFSHCEKQDVLVPFR